VSEPAGNETVLTNADGGPSAAGDLGPGDVVAGYVVDALAGAGGMAVVYRATDPELGRTIALKVISHDRAGDQRFRELFVRESLTAAALEHPNILPVYRAGEDGERLFIAMRFVDGESLASLIASEGPLPAR
jgi:serine/threonine protein kinase